MYALVTVLAGFFLSIPPDMGTETDHSSSWNNTAQMTTSP